MQETWKAKAKGFPTVESYHRQTVVTRDLSKLPVQMITDVRVCLEQFCQTYLGYLFELAVLNL